MQGSVALWPKLTQTDDVERAVVNYCVFILVLTYIGNDIWPF